MPDPNLRSLEDELRTISDLESAAHLLEWDQSTYMPEGGATARGRQLALLRELAHERLVAPRMAELITSLRPVEDRAEGRDAALVRVARREHERARRIPAPLVAEMERHFATSYVAWTKARPENDFGAVRPYLERTLELSKHVSGLFPEAEHPADPFIDESDPGMNQRTVSALFDAFRARLVPLVRELTRRPAPRRDFLFLTYDRGTQLDFGREIIERIGYDFERGRQDETAHPFMTRFAHGDVRITTRVRDDDLTEALFSTIHEAGHALYEQNVREDLDGTPLGQGVSAGVHESQSRLWENLVARSRPFWVFHYPKLQERFPAQLEEVSLDEFLLAINAVTGSLIRTDADEITYNLHVMLRVSLEHQLLEGTLAVRDLPEAWRAGMKADLGVEVPDDRDGCLQDVHWFVRPIGGFFQGYTLGNLMSAQFYRAALAAHPEIPSEMERGDFSTLRRWLRDHVYQHGAILDPGDLVQKATGAPLSVDPLIEYLTAKYA